MSAWRPTRFMTNSWAIAGELGKRCDGKRQHQQLVGGRAGPAARYPKGLCEAICMGLLKEMSRLKDTHRKLTEAQRGRISDALISRLEILQRYPKFEWLGVSGLRTQGGDGAVRRR